LLVTATVTGQLSGPRILIDDARAEG
jgi:hypothetical protein